jgi:hypothetical protein
MTVLPLTDFGPSPETRFGTALSRHAGKPSLCSRAPPMRFSAHPAPKNSRLGTAEVPPPTPSPYGLSQTLEGFPRAFLQPCFVLLTLIGFLPSKAFPSRRTLPSSSPGDTLSAFPRSPRRVPGCALRALCPSKVRSRLGSIASLIGPMLSWAFPLSRRSMSRVGAAFRQLIRS